PAQADPFARFSHEPDAHVDAGRAATAAPAYKAAEKTPSYAVPADRAPAGRAPADRTPSYATPADDARAAVKPRAYDAPDDKTRSHTTSTYDAPAYRAPAEYKPPVKTPSYATPYKAPVHDEQRYRAPVAPSAVNRSASRPHPKPTDDKK
ncbi:MAG: hypothetical protein IAI49_14265, partial [Candidatus Eremiobacteraeota bacterium]|nr:hypothetical protein [Candidatus Eremiobacteraeota bacterium]